MRVWLSALIFLAVFLALASPQSATAEDAVVTDVRITATGDQTRIVWNVSDSVKFTAFTLADPYRLVVDLPGVVWKLPPSWNKQKGGPIRGFRFGPLGPGRSRVVFDLESPVRLVDSMIVPPEGDRRYRIVLDLLPSTEPEFRKAAGWRGSDHAAPTTTSVAANAPKPKRTKKLICLDPGHGGIDPGASGVSGSLEKQIVLTAALKVRDVLLRSGRYDVHMTRETDIFLSLKARVSECRRVNSDLMISLHADSAGDADTVRGATVYTLSEKASDAEAEELAKSENQSDAIAGVALTNEDDLVSSILIDLAQRDTKLNSVRFAATLVPELQKTGRLVPKSHKFAGFRVLKAPDVPSVLIEMGYLTNAADETQLLSETWRAQMAQAILRSLETYFSKDRARKPAAKPAP